MDFKTCAQCRRDKPVAEFNFKSVWTGKRQSYCRECTRMQLRRHYEANRPYYLEKARQRTSRLFHEHRQRLVMYLQEHPCVDCGENGPRCLEFDHVRGEKRACVSRMLRFHSWSTILKEVEKCEVRCANCHRKRTVECTSEGILAWLTRP